MKWSGYWDAMFDKYWTDYIVELVAIYIVTRQIVIIAKAGMLWSFFFSLIVNVPVYTQFRVLVIKQSTLSPEKYLRYFVLRLINKYKIIKTRYDHKKTVSQKINLGKL